MVSFNLELGFKSSQIRNNYYLKQQLKP